MRQAEILVVGVYCAGLPVAYDLVVSVQLSAQSVKK